MTQPTSSSADNLRPRLIVFGANAVALHLLRMARELGYEPVLVEARTERVDDDLRAASAVVATSVADVAVTSVEDAVHVDHDAPAMPAELAAALQRGCRHVALVASRRHTAEFLERARAVGATDEQLARVNTPAGLDLGGRSAPEIALSVLAGLVAARYERSGGWLAAR